jgi:glycosyltransferase involved in cell wall biosynthesis
MSNNEVFISICIPAYKRVDFLKRLLDSIALQTYTNYEVIISDDSPGTEVEALLSSYRNIFSQFSYYKNPVALGTPENWNAAIRHAKGTWIKLMHDDDWFSTGSSLAGFAAAAEQNDSSFIFSNYSDVFIANGSEKRVAMSDFRFQQLLKEPVTLLSRNIIGPPSVVMHRNDASFEYDNRLKWLVDVDMYVRRLGANKIVYVADDLVRVGVGDDQVTASVHGAGLVEVPEHFLFLTKTGIGRLKNILVYDYWWRFIRNFQLTSKESIERFGYAGSIHPLLRSMMSWHSRLPKGLIKMGPFSKLLMFIHYCFNKHKAK